ncbi:MAG: SurA N-terminal domain-containing protein [Balneolaceae bacterium]
MGTMEKMRNSTPIILWTLIFSFGILWVLQDTQVFDAMAGGPRNLGAVNGDPISLEEFNNRVSYYVDQYNQQSDAPLPQGMRSGFDERAWDDLVAEKLMAQKMEQLGIHVSDEELVEMVTGENPDPFIRQQFQDEEGNIDRVALRAAIEAPENREIWMMIEQQLRQNRRQQKFSNFIMSGLRVSRTEVEQRYIHQNSFADIRYVRFPYASITDEEIQITDSELRDYYQNHRDQYQREETYRFRYVSFDKSPTREDTLRTVADIEELIPAFRDTEDPAGFLQRYQSAVPFRDSFVSANEIRDEYRPVLELEEGEVSEVYMIDGDPHAFKLVERQGDEVKFAVLSFNVVADPIATVDRRAEEADEFSFFAQEDGFMSEADTQELEVRQATATRGNPTVPGLGNARSLVNQLERMSAGSISDPIELNDVFVVAELQEKISAGARPLEEVRGQIENAVRNLKRKEITVQRAAELLNQQSDPDLEALAEASGHEIQEALNIRMGANNISGAGREPGIIGSIFGLEQGDLSGVLEGNNAAFVVRVEELEIANPENMTDQTRQTLRQQIEQQKFTQFNQVWLDELKAEANIRDNRHILLSR